MTKTVTRMIASVAALGLVATPIVAQANTRAGDSAATYSTSAYSTSNAGPGLGREAEGEGASQFALIGGMLMVLTPIVVATLLAAGIIQDDEGNCISPGAC